MDDLRERVAAVERALTDGDGDLTALAEGAASAERVAAVEDEVASLREDVAELEAATQALRGYVGNVRSVNESVEQRADAAVAAVDSLEERVDDLAERHPASTNDPPGDPTDGRWDDCDSGQSSLDGSAVADRTSRPSSQDGVEPTDPAETAGVCHACGRGSDPGQAAADGGNTDQHPVGEGTAGAAGATPGTDSGGTEPSTTSRSLSGFDPADGSHRVRIDRDGREPSARSSDGEPRRGAGRDGDPGLLARVRELL